MFSNYNVQVHAKHVKSRRWVWKTFLKVSKFQENQIAFAFSYSKMCISVYALCFIGMWFG